MKYSITKDKTLSKFLVQNRLDRIDYIFIHTYTYVIQITLNTQKNRRKDKILISNIELVILDKDISIIFELLSNARVSYQFLIVMTQNIQWTFVVID